jgi:hypothetical protein
MLRNDLSSALIPALALLVASPSEGPGQEPAKAKGDPGPRAVGDPALRDELLRMIKEDQDIRNRAVQAKFADASINERMAEIDRKNTARLKAIVEAHGWPGKTLVGDDGSHAAWLLVQHADRDRDFQRRCLTLLEKAVKAGEATGTDLAYLTDRVRVGDGRPQVYGTQFLMVEGRMEPQPIEDEARVDERRKAVGLPPLAEYAEQLRKLYAPKEGTGEGSPKSGKPR